MIGIILKLILIVQETTLLDTLDIKKSNTKLIKNVNLQGEGELRKFSLSVNQNDLITNSNICNNIKNVPLSINFKLDGMDDNLQFIKDSSIFEYNILSSLNVNEPNIYSLKKNNIQATLSLTCESSIQIVKGLIIDNNNILEFSNTPEQPLMQEYFKKIKNLNILDNNLVVVYNLAKVFEEEANLLSSEDYLSPYEQVYTDTDTDINIGIQNNYDYTDDYYNSMISKSEDNTRRRLKVSRWTNCFRNDNLKRQLNIGIAIGSTLYRNKYNNNLQTTINSISDIITKSNLVYGVQLNINLKVTKLYIAGRDGYPNWDNYASCIRKQVNINNQLSSFKDWARSQDRSVGLWHLLDNCFAGSGVVGLAWIGTLCNTRNGYNTGISWWSRRHWLTVAHELGHNFGAQHSFELGRGRTGGIMDYGNGLLNGEYQFNTRFRKNQVCRTVNNVVSNCNAFKIIGNNPIIPVPVLRPTLRPTLSPTKNNICRGVGGGSGNSICSFPFIFRGKIYNKCTKVIDPNQRSWCSTKTNRFGRHIQGNWAYCTPGCPGY